MAMLSTVEIMDILPHRQPFLLIDTVEELEPIPVATVNSIGVQPV